MLRVLEFQQKHIVKGMIPIGLALFIGIDIANAPGNKGNQANRRVEVWIVPQDRLFTTDGATVTPEAAPEAALGMLGKTLVGGLGMGAAALPGAAGTIHEAIRQRAAGEGREETQGEAATGLLGSPLLAAINTVVPGGIVARIDGWPRP